MNEKIKIGEDEYEIEKLSSAAKATVSSLKFIDQRIKELTNMQALLQRAKIVTWKALKQKYYRINLAFFWRRLKEIENA